MLKAALAFVVFLGIRASAHPVPFKDGTSITLMAQTFQTDFSITYSFHRKAAIGLRAVDFDDGITRMRYFGSQLNFLMYRWNGEDFQANLLGAVGSGPMTYNDHEHSTILTSIDADAETRQLFISGKAEKMWTGVGNDFWHVRSRIGAAPYAADFNDLATWFMIQYEYNSILRERVRYTPLIRLFYQFYLFEAGVSNKGETLLTFMVHI